MTRVRSILRAFSTVALAALLPAASLHCLTMARPAPSAGAMRADHACCPTGHGEPAPASPVPTGDACACLGLPAANTPNPISWMAPDAPASVPAAAAAESAPAGVTLPRTPRSSEPPPMVPGDGCRSLRGPPARA